MGHQFLQNLTLCGLDCCKDTGMPNHIPFAKRTMINGLPILLAIFLLVACSPSGENPSPLDIQKGPSSPYDLEANYVCVKEEDAEGPPCPQRVVRANANKRIHYRYTNVGRATIPGRGLLFIFSIDGTQVYQGPNYDAVKPGRVGGGSIPPRFWRNSKRGAGTYEVMFEVRLSEKFEEANSANNVALQTVVVRE